MGGIIPLAAGNLGRLSGGSSTSVYPQRMCMISQARSLGFERRMGISRRRKNSLKK